MNPKKIFFHKTFCPAPWNNLYIHPDGTTATCSVGKTITGDLKNQKIDDIVKNNDKLKEIQTAMLNNKFHSNCINCQALESSNDEYSLRKHYKKRIIQFDNLDQYDIPNGNIHISSLDIRHENTCQNACVYCGPELSSRWAKELSIKIEKPDDESDIKEFILDNISNLKEIYLAGGEPLVNKNFESVLNKLYDVNPDCKVRINSNIKNLNTPVYEISKKFKNLQYTISMEAVDEQFEYIRYPQKWHEFKKNYNKIIKEIPYYNFNMVLNILNPYGLFDSIDFLLENNTHENSFIITHAHRPNWCNINHLSEHILNTFVDKCENYIDNLNPKYNLYSSLVGCINFVREQENFNKNMNSVRKELKKIDDRRNLNSEKLFPYIYDMQN